MPCVLQTLKATTIITPPNKPLNCHISVFWQGHHFQLQITDVEGNVFSTASLAEALQDSNEGVTTQPQALTLVR